MSKYLVVVGTEKVVSAAGVTVHQDTLSNTVK